MPLFPPGRRVPAALVPTPPARCRPPLTARCRPPLAAPCCCSEFRKWIPSVNTIVYVGDAQSREVGGACSDCWLRRPPLLPLLMAAANCRCCSLPSPPAPPCRPADCRWVNAAWTRFRLARPQVLRAFEWETGNPAGRQVRRPTLHLLLAQSCMWPCRLRAQPGKPAACVSGAPFPLLYFCNHFSCSTSLTPSSPPTTWF